MIDSATPTPCEPFARSSRITVNLNPELHLALRQLAMQEGRSVSNLCLQLIEASLAERQRHA